MRPSQPSLRRHRAGYALPLVVVLLTAVLLMVGWLLGVLQTYSQLSKGILHQRQTFYACDGAERVMLKLTEDWLATGTGADADHLEEHICTHGGGCDRKLLPLLVPDDVVLTDFEVTAADTTSLGPLPSGPHRGLLARRQVLTLALRGYTDRSEPFACSIERDIVLGEAPVFQFLALSMGYADWFPTGSGTVEGRVHANGDLCFGSVDAVRFSQVSAAGRLLHASSEGCRHDGTGRSTATSIATNSALTSFSEWTAKTSHGCEGCGGSDHRWQRYAHQTWGSHALDEAHGVPSLRPSVEQPPAMQQGATASGTAIDNASSMRFTVDPPQDDDSADIGEHRLASRSHVRIINGVWFLRNPKDPTAWPGVPIWSDHPGSMSAQDEEGVEGTGLVGQADVASRWGWGSLRPRGFSYYGIDPATELLVELQTDEHPVLSYGTLLRNTTGAWGPAHWAAVGTHELCKAGKAAFGGLLGVDQDMGCNKESDRGSRLLNGTRSGFHDGHAEAGADADGSGHILPVNFDVASFLEQVHNADDGELGSYFCLEGSGCFMDEPFNGIVYVTATWPGSMDGLGDGWPESPPVQGEHEAAKKSVESLHPAAQGALPMPLCSTDTARIGEPLDSEKNFLTPSCTHYDYAQSSGGGARPNALRLVHAHDLLDDANKDSQLDIDFDADGRPDGLTIATNLPLYILGDVNTSSQVSSADEAEWTAFLVAADQVTLLSSDWQDTHAPWSELAAANAHLRVAGDTRATLQILSGWTETDEGSLGSYGGGFGGFVRGLEDWSSAQLQLTGSLVVGFHSVYFRWAPSDAAEVAQGVDLLPTHDPHLLHWEHQPPGDLHLMTWSAQSWARN